MSGTRKKYSELVIAGEAPDFRGGNLSGEVFTGLDLHARDFRRAILRNAVFVDCELTDSNFADADLSGANFRGAMQT